MLDAARSVHPTFLVLAERDSGGGFVKHADRFVSPKHQAVVQSYYKLSQDQGTLSFDERGFPWLFGASVLFGADLTRDDVPFRLPDNLGRANPIDLSWNLAGPERHDGQDTVRYDLAGADSLAGSAWFVQGQAWPARIVLEVKDDGLAPHVRAQQTPARMDARLTSLTEGAEPMRPRDRAAGFSEDNSVARVAWNGERPPDGERYAAYTLSEADRDARLLDRPLVDWLTAAEDPRLYRGTYQEDAGPAEGTRVPNWLLQYVDASNAYYEVEVERMHVDALGQGAPRVTKSGPAEPPSDKNHGWFAAEALPEKLVPLSEGVRIVRDVFGAEGVQIFLRSFADPPGYSYFLDGGFEHDKRYTVVYNPSTGLLEQATGPVSPRAAG